MDLVLKRRDAYNKTTMIIGPKFKIAKRLGAPIFAKTQTQKFTLSEARSSRNKKRSRPASMSNYKLQLLEKQKMRFSYGVSEKQLRRYIDEAVSKGNQPITLLMQRLESRLDNVVYRLGLAKTRQAARQMVSHGHILVNQKRFTIPSHKVRVGDVITVREGSKTSPLFTSIFEQDHEDASVPHWLTFDVKKLQGTKKAEPTYEPSETLFDPQQVLEFYSR